jgi:hypothetical protein
MIFIFLILLKVGRDFSSTYYENVFRGSAIVGLIILVITLASTSVLEIMSLFINIEGPVGGYKAMD